jgi:hypothetical protein
MGAIAFFFLYWIIKIIILFIRASRCVAPFCGQLKYNLPAWKSTPNSGKTMISIRLLIICQFGLAASVVFPQGFLDHETKIEIHAEPIVAFEPKNAANQRFGSLEYHGGLVLKSSNPFFGGLSALRMAPDGEHFLAVSDRATWMQGRIVYRNERPVSIEDVSLAPVLGPDGKPSPQWDTESIGSDGETLYVGLERINSIAKFDYGKKGIHAPGELIDVPPEAKKLPFNQGFESMVFVPKEFRLHGSLIAISERGLTEEGNIKAFLIGGPTPGMFAVKRTNSYDISDASILPDGDILILERGYSEQNGVSMRIRRIRQDDIKPGAVVDGLILIEADNRHQIDNMEAIGIHRARSGETILTLMSDDNQSPRQKTVLLQFGLSYSEVMPPFGSQKQ